MTVTLRDLAERRGRARQPRDLEGRELLHANRLLSALGAEAAAALLAAGRRIDLPAGRVLWSPGDAADGVYFPTSGLVAVLWTDENGVTVETAAVACEGAAGLADALAETTCGFTYKSVLSGGGWLIPASTVRAVLAADPEAMRRLWRHWAMSEAEARGATACRALHPVRARLADGLLDYAERAGAYDRLTLTHETLAATLGVCRTTVTAMMAEFSARRLIAAGRGRVAIADFDGLTTLACGCRRQARRGHGGEAGWRAEARPAGSGR